MSKHGGAVVVVEQERQHRGFTTWQFVAVLACTEDEARRAYRLASGVYRFRSMIPNIPKGWNP